VPLPVQFVDFLFNIGTEAVLKRVRAARTPSPSLSCVANLPMRVAKSSLSSQLFLYGTYYWYPQGPIRVLVQCTWPTFLSMQSLIRQLLHIVLLAATMMPVHAASIGATARCDRFDAVPPGARNTIPFKWTTEAPGPSARAPAPVRIGLWGDSLTSAPDFIDAALAADGVPKSSVLPSFIQAGIKVPGLSLPVRASCASAGWQVGYAHKDKHREAYSKGFLSMRSETAGDTVYVDFRAPLASTRVQALTVLYEKARPDGSLLLGVTIDGGVEQLISLSRVASTSLHITPGVPMATFRLRVVSGQVTLHGFAPRYQDAAPVVLDTMSVPGGLLRAWSNAADRFFSAPASAVPDYNVILVEYGTNEGASLDFDSTTYRGYLRSNLGRLRAFYPHARCILIGPPDRGSRASVHQQIAQAQQQIGQEFHCGFWNWQAAMGGPGAAQRWLRMAPAQMQPDLTHLTSTGYRASGRMFGTAFSLNQTPP
jgi:hypothetical protein